MQNGSSKAEMSVTQTIFPPNLPTTAVSRTLDAVVRSIGIVMSAVWAILVLAIVSGVALRYGAGRGTVMIEEFQWHLNAAGVAVAIAFTMTLDSQIRVNLLSTRFPRRAAIWVETAGLLVFLLPFCVFMVFHGSDFVAHSFFASERSSVPSGLSNRWIIKAFLPLCFLLLGLAGVSRLSRCLVALTERRA